MDLSLGEKAFWGGHFKPVEVSADAPIWAPEFLMSALAGSRVGTWQVNMNTGLVTWDAETSRIFGMAPIPVTTEALLPVHPDDQVQLWSNLERSHQTGQMYDMVFRGFRADGEIRWLHGKGHAYPAGDPNPQYMAGTVCDITEQKTSECALEDREARLSKIFAQALVGIMVTRADGEVLMVNSRFCEILGRSEDELTHFSLAECTHPDDLRWNLPLRQQKLAAGEPFQIRKRYLRPNGEIVWCNVSVSFIRTDDGEQDSSVIVAEDITAKMTVDAALRESEMLHRSVLEASSDCIKILSLNGAIEFVNGPGIQCMEFSSVDHVLGRSWPELWPEASRDMIGAALDAARAGESIRCTGFCPTVKGTPKWWDVSVTPMRDESGEIVRILAISRDITVQFGAAEKLRWASEHDALTELPNRRAFEAHLKAATIRAMHRKSEVGLLLLDLDHFKHINDTLGHAAGDHLLRVCSERLKDCVGSAGFVARLGGDEFAIIVEGNDGDALAVGEAALARLQEPMRFNNRVISARGSIGGAIFPQDAANANELLRNADIALYARKEAGRGGIRMFHDHMRQEAQLVSSQLSLAQSAVTNRSIEPHYQQKVELSTGRIVGFEALLRWRHPRRGIQQPDTVAEAFKDYELASKIGELMQRSVFNDVRGWLDEGLPIGFIAVNAAPAEFLRDDFAERLLARMEDFRIPPHLIEIEVTEHVFLERGSDYVGRALKLLSKNGVRVALDDFGTGYSSLSHLRDYPVDVVKIDKSFVEPITTDPEIRAIVHAVIDLASSLNIEVVAEGIESEEQMQLLTQDGCLMGQGYLFGRAIEASEVPALLAATARLSHPLCAASA